MVSNEVSKAVVSSKVSTVGAVNDLVNASSGEPSCKQSIVAAAITTQSPLRSAPVGSTDNDVTGNNHLHHPRQTIGAARGPTQADKCIDGGSQGAAFVGRG